MSSFIDENTLFILDSYGLIYREYFAFISRPLINSKGDNVSAVFGFFRNLLAVLKNYSPRYMVAAMDSKTPTFRHEMYAEYKATRQKTPEDLHAQIPLIEDILGTLGIPALRRDSYEADDIIATLAKKCEAEGRRCMILSADKDLQQLTNGHIRCMRPDKTQIWAELDEDGVEKEWGVRAEKLLDLLSLTGDAADNIPGVRGVGQKTAVKLLDEYGSLEGIYGRADEIKGAIGEKIRSGKESAFFSKKLITLRTDVPDLRDAGDFRITGLDFAAAAEKMTELELRSIARDYRGEARQNAVKSPGLPENRRQPSGQPSLSENHGDYKAVTDIKELGDYIEKILGQENPLLAFDTETDSLDTSQARLVGFSISYQKGSGVYVPVEKSGDLFDEAAGIPKNEARNLIRRLFHNPKCTIAMHNAKFDMKVLDLHGFIKLSDWIGEDGGRARIADTMIAAWLLEPDKSGKTAYSLEYLAEAHLRLKGTDFEEIVPKNKTFADIPLETAAAYSSEDSDFTLRLWKIFEPRLREEGLTELFFDMEMRVLPILARMEIDGIHIDPKYLNDYSAELKNQISAAEKEIYAMAGHEFNIASPKQLSAVLFEERRLPAGKKTKTGYSTDTSVLEELSGLDPFPGKILEYRGKSKLLSTYVETLPAQADENSRVHTSFMQTGTATGRLSSKDPNLQNIPVRSEEGRRIRSAFTAEKGTVLISADYSQIELVVLAHLSGDKNLREAFENQVDIHKSTASLIYGCPINDVTAQMRRNAKTLNFGLMYGMGAFSLAKDLGISRPEAKKFIDNYFAVYQGVKNFFDGNALQAQESGFVRTISGRRRKIPGINSKNKMEKEAAIRVAKNSPIQGSAADIVKKAMIDVASALKSSGSKARMLLQVHDELIFECPDDEKSVSEAIALIKDKMEGAVRLKVPLRVSIEYDRNWGKFH